MGQRGGGKGWCGACLRAEDLERRGFSRDDHYILHFTCLSCTREVRVIKESRKDWRKGTEHLTKSRLCQACVDVLDNETSEVNNIKAQPVSVFKISKPSNVADEIKGRHEVAAARDEWSKKVSIRALLHLNQIEETFVSQGVFLSQNFLNEKEGSL